MANTRPDVVLEHVRRIAADGAATTDGELLARFATGRDEAAFTALVQRHGPMVLSVCRGILRHEQDAEDAFQAAFLILARKAASVARRESVGCWLHQVAYHTALEASAMNARRRARERPVRDLPHPPVAPPESEEWRALLDQEIRRLPEKYRAAVVLCELEGRPRREAARELGLAEGERIDAVELQRPSRRPIERTQNRQERALARAARPQHGRAFAAA